jgi:hypothetical protein
LPSPESAAFMEYPDKDELVDATISFDNSEFKS